MKRLVFRFDVEVSDSVYEVGEEVEIVRGPLKGFSGELCYFEKGKPKVGISCSTRTESIT